MREAHRVELVRRQAAQLSAEPGGARGVRLVDHRRVVFEATEAMSEKTYAFALELDDFDVMPPELLVIDPQTGESRLERADWPNAPRFTFREPHPTLRRLWHCMPGLKEYHIHLSHRTDSWDNHRYTHTIPRIVENVVDALQALPAGSRKSRPPSMGRHSWRRGR